MPTRIRIRTNTPDDIFSSSRNQPPDAGIVDPLPRSCGTSARTPVRYNSLFRRYRGRKSTPIIELFVQVGDFIHSRHRRHHRAPARIDKNALRRDPLRPHAYLVRGLEPRMPLKHRTVRERFQRILQPIARLHRDRGLARRNRMSDTHRRPFRPPAHPLRAT